MSYPATAPEAGRFGSLDALRGVAAFLVLTFHCWKIGLFPELAGWQWILLQWTPLNLFFSGRPWVILFFVLSGFVLSCSLERAATIDYRGFVLRRLCRVYLPFVASILFSVVLYAAVRPERIPELGRWFNDLAWSHVPTGTMLAEHLLMTGLEGEDSLNPIMWSLVYELRISLLFPLLFLVAYRWPAVVLVLSVAGFVGAGMLVGCQGLQCQPFRGANYMESALLTVYFTVFFVVGVVLARFRNAIRRWLRALPLPLLLLFGIAAVYAMILPNNPRLMRFAPADPLFGLGAAAMIALAISGGAWQAMLDTPVLGWLGRVSYSLYLTHNIVLLAVVHLLFGRIGPAALLLIVVGASLAVAGIAWWLVEAPAHRLGQRLVRRPASRPVLAGQA